MMFNSNGVPLSNIWVFISTQSYLGMINVLLGYEGPKHYQAQSLRELFRCTSSPGAQQFTCDTFFKTTNTFSYVMGQSYHPPSTIKGITKEETMRMLRNCTKESDYKETMDFLKEKFKKCT